MGGVLNDFLVLYMPSSADLMVFCAQCNAVGDDAFHRAAIE